MSDHVGSGPQHDPTRLEVAIASAQRLTDEDTKILQAALAWDVEDVATAKRLMNATRPDVEDSIAAFCDSQTDSHRRLREEDQRFCEYHRGAQTAYEVMLERLGRDAARGRRIYPSPIHAQLDAVDVPKTEPGDDDGPQRRILPLSERVEWLVRHFKKREGTIAAMADLISAQAKWLCEVPDEEAPGAIRGVDGDPREAAPMKAEEVPPVMPRPFDQAAETKTTFTAGGPIEGDEDESRYDQLLRQREEARAGEDHWKSQRDAALRLLQWVLPDVVQHPSDVLAADLKDDTPDELELSDEARAELAARIRSGTIDARELIQIAGLA